MEASGNGLALDEFISHLRASAVLFMSLKEMVSNGKPKSHPKTAKFNYESLIFYHSAM